MTAARPSPGFGPCGSFDPRYDDMTTTGGPPIDDAAPEPKASHPCVDGACDGHACSAPGGEPRAVPSPAAARRSQPGRSSPGARRPGSLAAPEAGLRKALGAARGSEAHGLDRAGNELVFRLRPGEPALAVLQELADALPFYVMLVDSGHNILLANAAVTGALGVEPQAIVGGYCPKLVHRLEGPFVGCPLEEALRSRGVVEREYTDPTSGRTAISGIYPTRYRTETGLGVYLHTTRDISAQRTAEARVARSHEAQKLVNELLRISLQLDSLEEILEQVAAKMVAIPWLSAVPRAVIFLADDSGQRLVMKANSRLDPCQQRACAVVPFGKCLCGRAAATGEIQFDDGREHDRHELAVEGTTPHGHYCLPIMSADKVLGVISIAIDQGHDFNPSEIDFLATVADVIAGIIQRKRAEKLQREHERIALSRERMARIGEVSAGVAHTIRNPLHGVLNCVEILGSQLGEPEPAVQEVLSLMRDGLERIEKVTRRLLALTREAEPERRPTQLGDLLSDVMDLMAVQARGKQVKLQVEPEYLGEVMLNADRVVEGLTCVVSNAIDACEPGGVVTVRSQLRNGPPPILVLEVEDTGCGIPEENLSHVLDPFFTTKPIGEGSGLGLAITRRVVDEHGGDVEIRSTVGSGTRIRLLFPDPVPPESAEPS